MEVMRFAAGTPLPDGFGRRLAGAVFTLSVVRGMVGGGRFTPALGAELATLRRQVESLQEECRRTEARRKEKS